MHKKITGLALCALFFAHSSPADAQQPKKVPRIGYLSADDAASESSRAEPIRLALRELGYIEAQNIIIEYRYAEGKRDHLPELAAELVRLKVDIILAAGGDALIRPAMNATKTIPIVMVGPGLDPVKAGLVESLARPGGNITGLTNLSSELGGKRLELFKEAIPKLARVRGSLRSRQSPRCPAGERGPPSRGACAGTDRSVLGATSCGRFRQSIRCAKQGARGWTLCIWGATNEF